MTKKELIEALAPFPDDTLMVLSSDSEGNYYSPVASWCDGMYVPENTWSGQFLDDEGLKDFKEHYGEDELAGAVPAITLWPIN